MHKPEIKNVTMDYVPNVNIVCDYVNYGRRFYLLAIL